MKNIVLVIISKLPSLSCIIGAIVLAVNNIGNWGWFLVVSILLSTTFKISDDKKEKKSNGEKDGE